MIHVQSDKIDLSYKNESYEKDSEDSVLIHFNKDNIILSKPEKNISSLINYFKNDDEESTVYIGSFNGVSYFSSVDDCDYNKDTFEEFNMYSARKLLNKRERWISALAFQLRNWALENRFCGKCASRMVPGNTERNLICSKCKMTVYPKISPAVIVLIKNGDKILLARNESFPARFYSLIAGYVDIGESFEEAVAREVEEEVGLKVKNIKYYKSQPWPYSSSQMIGFTAELDGSEVITIDENEIAEAAWYDIDCMPEVPMKDSIAGEMIGLYLKGEL